MGHAHGRPEARRVHRDEPADRRDPGDGHPADLRQQPVCRGISAEDFQALLKDPNKPLHNLAVQATTSRRARPSSSSTGTGAPRGQQDHPEHAAPDPRLPDPRRAPGSTTGTTPASACATSTAASATRRTRSSSRWRACSASTGSRIGRASTVSARRPASTCPARLRDHPHQQVEDGRVRPADLPGRDLPGRDRPGLRRGDADPAHQRVRRPRERRQALPAADRPQGASDPTARSIQTFKPDLIRKLPVVAGDAARRCAIAARTTVTLRHTYNLVDMPVKVAGKSGTAEFGTSATARAACRSTRGSSGFVPKNPYKARASPGPTRSSSFLAFAYDSRTKGNAGTEIAKCVPAAPLPHQAGLPEPRPPRSAATSTRATEAGR